MYTHHHSFFLESISIWLNYVRTYVYNILYEYQYESLRVSSKYSGNCTLPNDERQPTSSGMNSLNSCSVCGVYNQCHADETLW